MAVAGQRERRSLWTAAIPVALPALSCVYPIFFVIKNALKTSGGHILHHFGGVTDPTVQNFADAWGRARFSKYFVSSVLVTSGAMGLLLPLSSLVGCAFAMLRFPGRRLVFVAILGALMIPIQVVLVPFYRSVEGLDVLNTRVGMVLAYTAFFLPFSIYLMTAFYRGLPRELLEAARMDGARYLEVWWHVMQPLGRPALLTLGILSALYCWNDVLISLLLLQDRRTLMVGIAALRGEYTTNTPLLAAGIVSADADRDRAPAPRPHQHHGLRQARPDQGDDTGRPHRGPARRADRAGRAAHGPLRRPRQPLRRGLNWQTPDELHPRRRHRAGDRRGRGWRCRSPGRLRGFRPGWHRASAFAPST